MGSSNDITWLFVRFQNDWAIEMEAMNEWDFMRIEISMNFGGISYKPTATTSLTIQLIHHDLCCKVGPRLRPLIRFVSRDRSP